MIRPDDLLMKAMDGQLSAAETDDLAVFLKADPAPRGCADLLQLEVLLRSERDASVVGAVMESVRVCAEAQTVRGVMKHVRQHKIRAQERRWRRRFAGLLALFLAPLAFAGYVVWHRNNLPVPSVGSSADSETSSIPALNPAVAPSLAFPLVPGPLSPPLDPRERVVLSLDFETEASIRLIESGVAVQGPERPGSRFSLIGQMSHWAPRFNLISVEKRPVMFVFNRNQVMRFWYYVDSEADFVVVQLKNDDQKQNYTITLKDLHHKIWTQASVRISDLNPNRDNSKRMEDGDVIVDFTIVAGKMGIGPLFVDDVTVVEILKGPVPPSTAALPPAL